MLSRYFGKVDSFRVWERSIIKRGKIRLDIISRIFYVWDCGGLFGIGVKLEVGR